MVQMGLVPHLPRRVEAVLVEVEGAVGLSAAVRAAAQLALAGRAHLRLLLLDLHLLQHVRMAEVLYHGRCRRFRRIGRGVDRSGRCRWIACRWRIGSRGCRWIWLWIDCRWRIGSRGCRWIWLWIACQWRICGGGVDDSAIGRVRRMCGGRSVVLWRRRVCHGRISCRLDGIGRRIGRRILGVMIVRIGVRVRVSVRV